MHEHQAAAFCRVEHTLHAQPAAAAAQWLVANAQNLRGRLRGLGGMALLRSIERIGSLREEIDVQRLRWRMLEGMGIDRLAVLGEEYCEERMLANLEPVGLELLEAARARGQRVILVSDNVEAIIRPLAERLGVEDFICNTLQVEGHVLTGRLVEPVFTGRVSGQWLHDYASDRSIDLQSSSGFGARGDDSLLLSAIGQPCAVNPDRRLRGIARELDWPVIER